MARRIAVVNDDTAFLDLMVELLTEEGYDVHPFKEATTAYQGVRDLRPDVIILDLFEYSDTACGAFVTHGAVDSSVPPVRTGAWTFFQGPVTTGATIHGAALQATAACPVTCPETTTVNYDDVAVQTEPLAVTVFSFSAHRAGKGVLLRWRTGTETNELGFNVYRRQGARRVRVNRRLLPALGAIAGSSYSYRDRRAPRHRALRYWLQDVAVDGTRTWHGPVRVSGA